MLDAGEALADGERVRVVPVERGPLAPARPARRDDEREGRLAAPAEEDGVLRGPRRRRGGEAERAERVGEAELVAVAVAADLLEPRAAEGLVEGAAARRRQVAGDVGAVDEARGQRRVAARVEVPRRLGLAP